MTWNGFPVADQASPALPMEPEVRVDSGRWRIFRPAMTLAAIMASRASTGVGHRVESRRPHGSDQVVAQRSTGEPVGEPAKRHRGRQRV